MSTTRRKVIDLVYLNAGGGHRASAEAIQAVVSSQRRPWDVRLVNLTEVLDATGAFRRTLGFEPEDFYNHRLRRGWTLGLAQELKLLQALIRLGHAPMVRLLRQHWSRTEPDLVVSLIPNFNRALFESVASALPGVPYVTALTDLADVPPNFWIERGQAQHFICGTDRAVRQARALGHPDERIHATSGMVLRPDFYDVTTCDRKEGLRRLGLDPERPTGLVLFGGHGSKAMLTIARRLPTTQLILVCGHNAPLQRQLHSLAARAPRCVLGYTDDIASTMRLADFFIGKPGPGSLSEALHLGLPVITTRNAWTMPQERYNTDWVLEQRVGIVHGSFRTVGAAVAQLLDRLDEFRTHVNRLDNRAVFEVPEILAEILRQSQLARSRGRMAESATAMQALAA